MLLGTTTTILYKKKKIDKLYFYFLNFCPSIFIYSSLSLKDTLSLIFSLVFAITMVQHKGILINMVIIFILFWIKKLNALSFFITYLFYHLFFIKKKFFILIFLIIGSILIFNNFELLLSEFNRYRTNFFYEANQNFNVEKLELNLNLFYLVFNNLFHFLSSPIYNVNSIFKLLQVIENLFFIFLLVIFFLKTYEKNKKIGLFGFFLLY